MSVRASPAVFWGGGWRGGAHTLVLQKSGRAGAAACTHKNNAHTHIHTHTHAHTHTHTHTHARALARARARSSPRIRDIALMVMGFGICNKVFGWTWKNEMRKVGGPGLIT